MTLIELLLVMGLLGLLLGVGVGALASLDLGSKAAVGMVQNGVRAARNAALARASASRVEVDVEAGELVAEVLQPVGTWHFEDASLEGAFGIRGVSRGASVTDDGFIGRALALPGGRTWAEFPVQDDPSFDLERGFALELALVIEEGGGGRVLHFGQTLALDVTGSGAVRAIFVAKGADRGGSETRAGRVVAETRERAVLPGRWARVRADYDRRLFRVEVDGVEEARVEEDAPVWRADGPLVVGDEQSSFRGAVDKLVLSAYAAGEPVRLPETVRFVPRKAGEARYAIRFDAGGNLDREVHTAPASIELELEDGDRARVTVGLYGTVE
jgi:type II secretory pathway pseudopilin PulG